MKSKTWILGAALMLSTGVLAWAGSPAGPRERVPLRERLGLSSEQAEQWQKMRSEQQKASVQRRADRQKLHIELRDLLAAPTLNEGAVRAKSRQLAELQATAMQERIEARLALRKLLTPEQIEKLRELRPGREAARERWRHRRGGRADDARDDERADDGADETFGH